VLRQLEPPESVYQNVQVLGRMSRVSREIDVQVLTDPSAYDFIAFECKDHARPIDVPKVEAFATKLRDVGAAKGAIVSNSGFSEAALNMADACGIDTLALVDTEDPDVATVIAAPSLVRDVFIAGIFVTVLDGGPITADADAIELVFGDSPPESASFLVGRAWNSQRVAHARGNHWIPLPDMGVVGWRLSGEDRVADALRLGVRAEERCWHGHLRVLQSEGLLNVRTSAYQTRSMLHEALDTSVVASTWHSVTSGEADQLQAGQVTLVFEVSTPAIERETGRPVE
jgi:hypothetical protein